MGEEEGTHSYSSCQCRILIDKCCGDKYWGQQVCKMVNDLPLRPCGAEGLRRRLVCVGKQGCVWTSGRK